MKDRSIVIVGDSPATYVCAIYLFTANIKPTVIRMDQGLEYACTFTPGLESTKDEYNQKCYEQAKNMGIEILEGESKIGEKENAFKVETPNRTIDCDFLIVDTLQGLNRRENLFVVEDLLLEKEAIVVAGVGCTIAFEIKEMMN